MQGFLWTASIVGLLSASAVITCKDGTTCNNVRVIVQNPSDVTGVLKKYPRAQVIDFHGNLMETYQQPPAAQWQLLNLSYNLLTEDMFRNVNNWHLEVIDLTYNRLRTVSVPASVTDFIAERNQLHYMTIGRLSKLQRLILPKNQFESLKSFANLPNLQELDLSCNDLSELNVDQLPASLRTLKLARNHIHSISGSKSLQLLEYLDLSHNILTTFSESQIVFPSIRHLYLQNNKIVMWIDVEKANTYNTLQHVNLLENDWDCNNLKKVLIQINGKAIQGPRSGSKCLAEHNFICCTFADSPYADRLIKYRKQEFRALQEGTAQRLEGNVSCSQLEPNPCDGDDNLVYKVAGSAVSAAKSLAESSLNELEQTLQVEKNIVDRLEKNVTNYNKQYNEQSAVHADLVSYIRNQYSSVLPLDQQTLDGNLDEEVGKLQALFTHYERENENVKQQINAEERKNQDKLNEINILEREMEDLNYQKDRLTEEVAKRNATVNDYKAKIEKLNLQLAGKNN